MTAKAFYEKYDIKALYELPTGLVALKEEDLFQLMEAYTSTVLNGAKGILIGKPNIQGIKLKEDDTTGDT